MSLSKAWHDKHPMPKNATLDQRIRWHRQHAKHCGCRPIPAEIAAAMKKGERG
jgi:hypothetical protein